jgi:cyclopropane fatty-acyl-phospholipid synthase-like methyltransferase
MDRIPEPELMLDPEQARAYAGADFEEPHARFVELFQECFYAEPIAGHVLDLGCGPGDVAIRFAKTYPESRVDGIDGSQVMIDAGREALQASGVADRIRLVHGLLPADAPPRERYDAIISNSLLHHLHDPSVLWRAVSRYAKPTAPVFIMDLMRPDSREGAEALVEEHAAGEPEILRRDFFNSLLAAFRPGEVKDQIRAAGLHSFAVEAVSDRHLIAFGRRG